MSIRLLALATGAAAALVATTPYVHDGTGLTKGFAAGVLHPLAGLDYVVSDECYGRVNGELEPLPLLSTLMGLALVATRVAMIALLGSGFAAILGIAAPFDFELNVVFAGLWMSMIAAAVLVYLGGRATVGAGASGLPQRRLLARHLHGLLGQSFRPREKYFAVVHPDFGTIRRMAS